MNCSKCSYSTFGNYDALSDICDSCRSDPDTGWFGFTDHAINKHFDSEEDAKKYYDKHGYFPSEDDDDDD